MINVSKIQKGLNIWLHMPDIMSGDSRLSRLWILIKEIDEYVVWSIALIAILIIMIIGNYVLPSTDSILRDNIEIIIITVLIIFLRLTHLHHDDVKALIIKRFSDSTYAKFIRDDYYKDTYDYLRKAPDGSNVYVTNFEKIDVPYDISDSTTTGYEWEKKLMKLWDKRVKDGDFIVSSTSTTAIDGLTGEQSITSNLSGSFTSSGWSGVSASTVFYQDLYVSCSLETDFTGYKL